MRKKERIDLTCGVCGSQFRLLECQTRKGRGQYCSRACAGKGISNGTMVKCSHCGVSFYRRMGEQGESRHQFCSRGCYSEWRIRQAKDSTYLKDGAHHVHRIVAEAYLGRCLACGETVHHVDEDKKNNHPSNLAVFPSQSEHARCHFGEMSADELSTFLLVNINGES